MLRELTQLLPAEAGSVVIYLAMAGAVVGLGLWLTGARQSRGLITLMLVGLGGLAGRFLPQWMGWDVSGMAPAVGLALVGGVAGFALHRLWVGMALGAVLGLWAMFGCWAMLHGDYVPDWQSLDMSAEAAPVLVQLWEGVPENLRRAWPLAGLAGLACGLMMTTVWPRVTIVTLYSLLGATMFVGLGLLAMRAVRPEWLDRLPQQTGTQIGAFAALVLTGAAVQWLLLPRRRPALPRPQEEEPSPAEA